jgi:hypothetical protein
MTTSPWTCGGGSEKGFCGRATILRGNGPSTVSAATIYASVSDIGTWISFIGSAFAAEIGGMWKSVSV